MKLLCVLLFAILSASTGFTIDQEGWKSDKLKGKVETMIKKSYNVTYTSGKPFNEPFGESVYKYDINGNTTKFSASNSNVSGEKNYTYDGKGRIIKEDFYNAGKLSTKEVYIYDDSKNEVKHKSTTCGTYGSAYGSDPEVDIYKYDDKGNKIEHALYDNGSLRYKDIYKYNDKGNMTQSACYGKDGDLADKSIFKYDNHGKMVEETKYDSKGDLKGKLIYKYDDKGNTIYAEHEYNNHIYKYDDKSNMVEDAEYNKDGKFTERHIYRYDGKGNIIESEKYNERRNESDKIVEEMTGFIKYQYTYY